MTTKKKPAIKTIFAFYKHVTNNIVGTIDNWQKLQVAHNSQQVLLITAITWQFAEIIICIPK